MNWNIQNAEVIVFLDSIRERLGNSPTPRPTTPKKSTPILQSYQDLDGKNGILTDSRDTQTYKTIKIGNQIWMSENLNFEIEGSYWYDNEPKNGEKYGRPYTWEAAKKACPKDWRLPTDAEWKELVMKMGGYYLLSSNKDIGDPQKATKL